MPFAIKTVKRMAIAIIATGWMFTIASSLDALFPDSRGLAFGGPMTNQIAFFLFYIGIVMVMWILFVIGYRSYFPKR